MDKFINKQVRAEHSGPHKYSNPNMELNTPNELLHGELSEVNDTNIVLVIDEDMVPVSKVDIVTISEVDTRMLEVYSNLYRSGWMSREDYIERMREIGLGGLISIQKEKAA